MVYNNSLGKPKPMELDDCMQEKCNYSKLNMTFKGQVKDKICAMCPVCVCGAPSNKINSSCKKCIACENIPNFIRGRDPTEGLTNEQIIKLAEENVNPEPQKEKEQLLPKLPPMFKRLENGK